MDSSELRRGRDFKLQLDLTKQKKKIIRLKIHRLTELHLEYLFYSIQTWEKFWVLFFKKI